MNRDSLIKVFIAVIVVGLAVVFFLRPNIDQEY